MQALLIFPHQLFKSNVALIKSLGRAVLVEDALFFTQYRFHKQKLVLHRASMQMHACDLQRHGTVEYWDAARAPSMCVVLQSIRNSGVSKLHYIDVVDDWLGRRIRRAAQACGLEVVQHDSPMFLTNTKALAEHFSASHPAMSRFYPAQRVAHGVLVIEGRPVGGKWSFDAANRKRLPRGATVPLLRAPDSNRFVKEAQAYVEQHFSANPGHASPFEYPVTHADASQWLAVFTHERLARFGDYEDAISERHGHLFHSVLTPMLNTGLLTPREVIDAALAEPGVPLNSLEGFVRQVLGWREYVRGAYLFKGRAERTRNFWKHSRAIPQSFWHATVGIAPVDLVISRVLRCAYAHHIERLMVLANFMLLCEFHPDQVYRWFMQMFIDAYDWVMVPNVYGMGLYADGGAITTKPYIGGSNYLLKMSDLKPGTWCSIWDGLYWRFVAKNRDVLAANLRSQMAVRAFERMPATRRESHIAAAEQFLTQL